MGSFRIYCAVDGSLLNVPKRSEWGDLRTFCVTYFMIHDSICQRMTSSILFRSLEARAGSRQRPIIGVLGVDRGSDIMHLSEY